MHRIPLYHPILLPFFSQVITFGSAAVLRYHTKMDCISGLVLQVVRTNPLSESCTVRPHFHIPNVSSTAAHFSSMKCSLALLPLDSTDSLIDRHVIDLQGAIRYTQAYCYKGHQILSCIFIAAIRRESKR